MDEAYLAAIIDGEGYVGIAKVKTNNKFHKHWYQARITVRMKAPWLAEWMSKTFDGSHLKSDKKGLYGCEWRGKKVKSLLLRIIPYLKHKKPQAFGLLDYIDIQENSKNYRNRVVGYRSIKNAYGWEGKRPILAFNEEYLSECEELYQKVKSMNSVGKESLYKANYVVPKGWGYEVWIVNKDYCGKKLYLYKNKMFSWHYHKIKDETFYVNKGELEIWYGFDDDIAAANHMIIKKGDVFHVPVGLRHRLKAIKSSEIIEFSTTHFDDDSYRIIKGD